MASVTLKTTVPNDAGNAQQVRTSIVGIREDLKAIAGIAAPVAPGGWVVLNDTDNVRAAIKDSGGHYWQLRVATDGSMDNLDLGTTRPT